MPHSTARSGRVKTNQNARHPALIGRSRPCCPQGAGKTPPRSRCWPGSLQPRCRAGSRLGRGSAFVSVGAPVGGRHRTLGPRHARHNGFDLHAGLCACADQRDRLDRICRYALRPPVAQDRLQFTADSQSCRALRPAIPNRQHSACRESS